MKTLPLSEVKAKLSELVDEVASREERVVITRRGRPAAQLVSNEEMESLQETMEILSDPALMAKIRRGQREIDQGRFVSYAEVFGTAEPVSGRKTTPRRPAVRRSAKRVR